MAKKNETLFKNTIGRPTNEIKKKRKTFVLGVSLAIILGLFAAIYGILNISNVKLLKGATSKVVRVDAYASASDGSSITPINFSDRYVIDDVSETGFKLQYVYYRAGDVANSKNLQIPDGKLDSHDTNMILKLSAGLVSMDERISKTSDVNTDKKILASDARYVKRMSGDSSTLPYGDANGDKKIDNADKETYYNYIKGKINLTNSQLKRMDINSDGKVDNKDYKMLSYLGGDKFCVSRTADYSNCSWKNAGYKVMGNWTTFNNLMPNTAYYIYVKTFNNKVTYLGLESTKSIGDVYEKYDSDNTNNVEHVIAMPKFEDDELVIGVDTSEFKIGVFPSSDTVTLSCDNPSVISLYKMGDNSASGNKWKLKALKQGVATITATSYMKKNGVNTIAKQVEYKYNITSANIGKVHKVTFKANSITKSLDFLESNKVIESECVVKKDGTCSVSLPIIQLTTEKSIDMDNTIIDTGKFQKYWSAQPDKLDLDGVSKDGDQVTVSEDKTYYVYTKFNYNATFNYITKDKKKLDLSFDCDAINSLSCTISKKKLSSINKLLYKNSYTPVLSGFTTSESGTTKDYSKKTNGLTLTSDVNYYSLLKYPFNFSLTLEGGESNFESRAYLLVMKRQDGADAHLYGTQNTKKGIVTLPRFNIDGRPSLYWVDKSEWNTKGCKANHYKVGTKVEIGTGVPSMTLIPSTCHWTDGYKDFIPSSIKNTLVDSFVINKNTSVEVLNEFQSTSVINKESIKKVYNKVGKNKENVRFLFETPTKVLVMSNDDYSLDGYAGDGLTTSSDTNYSQIYIKDLIADTENGYLHELAHAWDHAYEIKLGERAHCQVIFMNYYNKYLDKNLLEYGYKKNENGVDEKKIISPTEFFAASVTNYYWRYVAQRPDKAIYGMVDGISSNNRDMINEDFYKNVMGTLLNNYNSKK